MPSSAAPYRFGHSRRTDHAVAMPVEKDSFVRPDRVFLPHEGSRYRATRSHQMGLSPPAQLGAASCQTDTLAALRRITASSLAPSWPSKTTQTLSLSMKQISWTSQLL